MRTLKKLFPIIIASLFLLSACKDESPSTRSANTNLLNLSGFVVDESGAPLSDVTVTSHGRTYTTQADGGYFFENLVVPAERFIVNFEKHEYFKVVRSEKPGSGTLKQINVGMISKYSANAVTTSFHSSTGGEVSFYTNSSIITFPANNFIDEDGNDFTGIVYVAAAYVNPTTANARKIMPGGDLRGKDDADNDVILNAYSGMYVELTDAQGNKLNIKNTAKAPATIEFEIPTSLMASAPDVIDIWDFNGNVGMFAASGTGNKNGGKHIASISHFSYWACQIPHTGMARVKGKVVDCEGNGVPGIEVKVGQSYAITDANGRYTRMVPDNLSFDIGIYPDYYGNVVTPQTVTPLQEGEVYTLPDIVVECVNVVTGRLVNCNGTPVRGRANAVWSGMQGQMHAGTPTPNGDFRIVIGNASFIELHCFGNNCETSESFSISSQNTDLGDIYLCPPPMIGTNKVSITRDNQIFTYDDFYDYYGTLYESEEYTSTSITLNGSMSSVGIYFSGNQTGSYPISSYNKSKNDEKSYGASVYLTIDGLEYNFSQGNLNVTKYDNVGGLIEGTVNGMASEGYSKTDSLQTEYRVNIEFSVERKPNGN